jgi:phospholipid-binding lipoprotein MlaA
MKRQLPLAGLLVLVVMTGAGCSTAPSKQSGQPPDQPYYERDRMMVDDVDAPLEIHDPWEGFNRTVFRFNSYADRWVLNPAVSVYRFVFPGFVRKGVSNFFTNLDNIQTVVNEIFQLHPGSAVQTTGRFIVNTTIGVAGLWDPATPIGIPQHYEDFGQTLGRWGVGTGPYLVLPLFGPSFARDATGKVVDAQIFNLIDPLQLDDVSESYTYLYWTLLVLNTRSTTSFQYYQTGSPFEYELVRLLWHTKRQLDVEKY